jgi:hypothetical protein
MLVMSRAFGGTRALSAVNPKIILGLRLPLGSQCPISPLRQAPPCAKARPGCWDSPPRQNAPTGRHGTSLSAQECPFGRGEFGAVVAAWEQVPVAVCRHLNRRVAEPGLHDLEG